MSTKTRGGNHCRSGLHEFTKTNTLYRSNGTRLCRACRDDRDYRHAMGLSSKRIAPKAVRLPTR